MRSIHKTMSEILPLLASPEGKNQSGTTVPFLFWCFLRAPRLVNLPPFFAPEQQANLCGVLEGNQKRAASQTPKVGGWFSKEPPFFFRDKGTFERERLNTAILEGERFQGFQQGFALVSFKDSLRSCNNSCSLKAKVN